MKFLPLIWAGLWRKPLRTVFTLLSIMIAFVLFGILQGVDGSVAHVQDAARLDRLVVDPRFGTPMPISYRQQILSIPEVTVVDALAFAGGYWRDQKNGVGLVMTDDQFFAVRPELPITKAQLDAFRHTRTGMVVSGFLARKYGWKVGDKVPIHINQPQKNGSKVWTFDIIAILDESDVVSETYYMIGNYDYYDQARAKDAGTITRLLLLVKDPNRAAQVGKKIDALFANSSVATRTESERAQAEAGANSVFNIGLFTKSVVGAVFFSLLFVTANTMMQSVSERTPEFAVLKTLGFTDGGVLGLVLSECSLVCVSGALIGLGVARLIMPLAEKQVGPVANIPPIVMLYGLIAAVLVALASGLPPAWRARQIVIVDALAGR